MRNTLGSLELVERIGRGAMGEVWRAHHPELGIDVAVKVLSEVDDPRGHATFAAEVRAVASLRHPHILWILDHGVVPPHAGGLSPGAPFLVTELATRGSLHDWMQRAPLGWADIRAVALATLDALAHAHARGVVHRDLKAGNILLTDDPDGVGLRLADFGIAHVQGERVQAATAGTLSAMAPEQLRGDWHAFGPPTDLYALGCLLHRMVNGRAPFTGAPRQVVLAHMAAPPPPLVLRDDIPDGLQDIVARLLRKSPRARYQRAADVAWALERLGPAPCPPPPVASRAEGEPNMTLAPQSSEGLDTAVQRVTLEATVVLGPAPAGSPHDDPDPDAPPPGVPEVPATWRTRRPRASGIWLRGAGLRLFGLRDIPLVGRETERDRLWEALRALPSQERPHLVLIDGPEGVGKRALAHWLRERAHEVGVANSLVVPPPRHPADDALGAVLIGALGLERAAWPDDLPNDLRDDLSEWLLRDAGHTLPETRRAILRRWLELQARRRPLLLVVEELQRHESAEQLVRDLVRDGVGPMLVVATWPAGDASGALAHQAASRLSLDLLPATSVRDLVAAMLPMSDDLAARLERRSAGHPLLAVQLVRTLVQSGTLRATPRGVVLRGELPAPEGLVQAWRGQLEAVVGDLDQAEALPLLAGAVLGPTLVEGQWAALCASLGYPLSSDLIGALADAGLVVPVADGWGWAHVLLRECLLDEAARQGRLAQLHGACADFLATAGAPPARLGRHLALAGRHAEALERLIQACDDNRPAKQPTETSAIVELATSCMDALGLAADDPRRLMVLLHRSYVAQRRGHLDEASSLGEALLAAASALEWSDMTQAAVMSLAGIDRLAGRHATALDRLEALLSDPALLEGGREAARLQKVLVLQELGRSAEAWACATVLMEQDLQPFRAAEALVVAATVKLNLDGAEEVEEGRALLARARATFHDLRARVAVANCDLLLGANLMGDDPEEAERRLQRALASYRRMGSTAEVRARLHLAGLRVLQGRCAEVLPELEQIIDTLERGGRRSILGTAGYVLCQCYTGLEAWDAAATALEKARALTAETGLVEMEALRHLYEAGLAALDGGQPALARRCLDQGREMAAQRALASTLARFEDALRALTEMAGPGDSESTDP